MTSDIFMFRKNIVLFGDLLNCLVPNCITSSNKHLQKKKKKKKIKMDILGRLFTVGP